MKNKAIFKWNNGDLALLCSGCNKIIKEGKDFTEGEMLVCMGKAYAPKQYCNSCIEELIKKDKNESN